MDYISKQIESENATILVVKKTGSVIGYSLISIAKYPPVFQKDSYGLISDIVVSKKYRRLGIGLSLFKSVQSWFFDKGISRIELRVANVNSAACGFWETMGFKPYMTTMYKEM